MSRASEREAAEKAAAIIARNSDAYAGDEYGAGKLTRAQRKSQERHIPMTERDNSRSGKIKRALWG